MIPAYYRYATDPLILFVLLIETILIEYIITLLFLANRPESMKEASIWYLFLIVALANMITFIIALVIVGAF